MVLFLCAYNIVRSWFAQFFTHTHIRKGCYTHTRQWDSANKVTLRDMGKINHTN